MNPRPSAADELNRALDELQTSGLTVDQYVTQHPEVSHLGSMLGAAELSGRVARHRPAMPPGRVADGQARLLAHFSSGRRPALRLRLNWAINTDKEYMAGLRHVLTKYWSVSTHYDSGAGMTVTY